MPLGDQTTYLFHRTPLSSKFEVRKSVHGTWYVYCGSCDTYEDCESFLNAVFIMKGHFVWWHF